MSRWNCPFRARRVSLSRGLAKWTCRSTQTTDDASVRRHNGIAVPIRNAFPNCIAN
jgi:hypothetical protein